MKANWALLPGALIAASIPAACGKQIKGEATKTATDASGAIIVGATVTATNTATCSQLCLQTVGNSMCRTSPCGLAPSMQPIWPTGTRLFRQTRGASQQWASSSVRIPRATCRAH